MRQKRPMRARAGSSSIYSVGDLLVSLGLFLSCAAEAEWFVHEIDLGEGRVLLWSLVLRQSRHHSCYCRFGLR